MGLELITYSISDIGKVITGKTPPASIKSAYSALDGVPFVTPKDMDGRRWIENTERYLTSDGVAAVKRNLVPAMSVAVSCIGSDMGKAVLLKKESITNQQINSIVIDVKRFNPKYIYYVLSTKQQYFKDIAGGSATPILNKTDFGKITFQAPSKYYQDLIVEYLDCLDSKRELNRQINQTLEQMAQALFKSWFVDFDPVVDNALDAGFFEQDLALPDELLRRAEARRAVREHGDFKPLPDAIRQLFPSAFEECAEPSLGLGGWVPQGWRHGCVADVARYSTKRIDTQELTLENYISTENMLADRKGIQPAANLPTVNSVPAYTTGSILISNIRPYFKKIWLANGCGGHSNDVLGFEAKDSDTECYVFNLMYQDSFFDFMMATSKGSKMPRGDKKAILEWGLIVPPLNLRQLFSEKVSKFYTSSYGRHHENITLAQLRDTLLPKLISGELRLDNIEADLTKEEVA